MIKGSVWLYVAIVVLFVILFHVKNTSDVQIEGLFGDLREVKAELRFHKKRLELLERPKEIMYIRQIVGGEDGQTEIEEKVR